MLWRSPTLWLLRHGCFLNTRAGSSTEMHRRFERMEQVGVNAYVDVNFPYGGELHRVIFLLWVDAKLHIEAGDVETAILDLRAMVNASRSIGDYPGITAQTSRAAGLLRAIPCVETALAQGQAGTKSLATLQALLEDEAQHPGRMIAIRGDRAMADDLMEQIDSGKLGLSAIPNFSAHPFWIKSFSNRDQPSGESGESPSHQHAGDRDRPVA